MSKKSRFDSKITANLCLIFKPQINFIMRKSIKHLLMSSLFLLFLLPLSHAQGIAMVQHHHVDADNRAEFIHRETTYWAEIAKAAIKDGKMNGWELWEKVGGWNMSESPNFMFVNYFTKIEDVNNLNEVWTPAKVFPNVRMQDMNTRGLSTLHHQLVYQGNAGFGNGKYPNFVRINYSKASDLDKYLELERTVWQPFIKQQIESGNTTQVSWQSGVKIMPFGADFPYNAISSDGFMTLSEAIAPRTSYKTAPTYPDMTEINKVHVKQRVYIYRLVKEVH